MSKLNGRNREILKIENFCNAFFARKSDVSFAEVGVQMTRDPRGALFIYPETGGVLGAHAQNVFERLQRPQMAKTKCRRG